MKKLLLAVVMVFMSFSAQAFAQEEGEYTMYVSATCVHCQKVEEFVAENNLGVYVNYVSVDTDDGYSELQSVWEEFDVPEQEMGWPFMVYEVDGEQKYYVGDEPIIDYLAQVHNIDLTEVEEQKAEEKSNSGNAIMLVGGVFFVAIVGLSVYSLTSGKKNG